MEYSPLGSLVTYMNVKDIKRALSYMNVKGIKRHCPT